MLGSLWGRGGRDVGGMVVCSTILMVGVVVTGAVIVWACGAVAVTVVWVLGVIVAGAVIVWACGTVAVTVVWVLLFLFIDAVAMIWWAGLVMVGIVVGGIGISG